MRSSLAKLIDGSPGYRCVSQHGSAETALREIPKINPDVVLMDINLPGISGVECVRRLKPLLPATQVIMLTVYQNTENIFNALAAGATGYMLKQTPPAELLTAIQNVHAGGSPMSSHIARKIVQSFQQRSSTMSGRQSLSPREVQVLNLLAKGFLYKEIADYNAGDLRHRPYPHPPHLRKAPRPFADGGGGQAPESNPTPARAGRNGVITHYQPAY